jgi:septal ring factor EnvC (AmiA/AmiB activator)
MSPEQVLQLLGMVIPTAAIIVAIITGGVIYSNRMKIKNGYPLSGAWGQAVYPKATSEDGERIKLLSQENAQLRAELGSLKDRLGNVERIVTDSGYQLTHSIEALRELPKN